ncbi:MAG: M23 family metallopeptidase [Candidatus Latescibacterota bacterium]|nr:MAG: M23 family metallopeptidase [Candidatus Latescibacterota bacterium]
MKRYLSLIVMPHDSSTPRNYRISYLLIYTFGVLLTLAVLSVAVLVVGYGRLMVKARQADLLATENLKNNDQTAVIDSLKTELVRLQAMGIQIKNMLGVDLSTEDSLLVANLSPNSGSPAIAGVIETPDAGDVQQKLLLKAIPSMWPVKGYVTRDFHTTGGEKSESYHPGMDIAAKRNTAVQASAEGVVIKSEWDEVYGFMVVLDHGFGLTTLYGHNTRNLVKVGDRVARGQTIAFLGSTGKSTAPHLHFEVRKNGVSVDPREYLLN